MNSKLPLVSVLIPTTHDRAAFNNRILRMMRAQDYPNKEIIFNIGPGKIGEKRNRLCSSANGEIILHVDSDDLYKPDWISKCVKTIIDSRADVVGMDVIRFLDNDRKSIWMYEPMGFVWLSGATLCYKKSVWDEYPFPDRHIGEDSIWVRNMPSKFKVHRHGYIDGFMASIHNQNTAGKDVYNTHHYTKLPTFEVDKILKTWGEDLLLR